MGGFISKVRQGLDAAKKAAAAVAKACEAIKRAAAAAKAKLVALFSGLPRWAQIGIPVAAVAVLVAGLLGLAFCCLPAGAAAGGAMMVAPGAGGVMVLRSAFVAQTALYFSLLHSAGPAAAVASLALVA